MAKTFTPTIFAANDLIEGDSVYLGPEGWVRDVALASAAATPEEAAALEARAREGERLNIIVGAYAVEVGLDGGRPWPLARREQIKASRATTMAVGPDARLSDAA